jgi:hypothetical protein
VSAVPGHVVPPRWAREMYARLLVDREVVDEKLLQRLLKCHEWRLIEDIGQRQSVFIAASCDRRGYIAGRRPYAVLERSRLGSARRLGSRFVEQPTRSSFRLTSCGLRYCSVRG